MSAISGAGRRLDVLHVVTSTQRRGAESFAVSVQQRLAARGHRASVVALTRANQPPELAVTALGRKPLGPTTLRRLRQASRQVDVVIAHGSTTLPASVLALAGRGTPVVYRNIGDPLFWASSPARRIRVRLLLSAVRAVAALTESSRQVLIRDFGMRPHEVRVIPNGRSAVGFPRPDDAQRKSARAALGLPVDRDVVLYLGALSPEKRPDIAIDAVLQLGGRALLMVVGDGPLRGEMQRLAAVSLGDRAVFLGTRGDVPQILAAADLLVLPSDTEGVPGVVIEAGFAGLPVVATDVGYVREVVVDGVTGLLVPPGDAAATATAIGRALGERRALGAAGHAHCVNRFEIERVVDAWESLLWEVTS